MKDRTRPSTPAVVDRLIGIIKSNPGIHTRRISVLMGVSWNTCQYYLRRMKVGESVTCAKVNGRVCWFDRTHGAPNAKQAIALLRDAENLRIARRVLESPGSNQLTLARSLNLACSVVHRRVSKMEGAGLLLRTPSSRSIQVFPSQTLPPLADWAGVPAPRGASFASPPALAASSATGTAGLAHGSEPARGFDLTVGQAAAAAAFGGARIATNFDVGTSEA